MSTSQGLLLRPINPAVRPGIAHTLDQRCKVCDLYLTENISVERKGKREISSHQLQHLN
jgi:hypothetical protein